MSDGNGKQEIDISFIFNSAYAVPTLVALSSLARHKAPTTSYRIFCVTPEPLAEWQRFREVAEREGIVLVQVVLGAALDSLASMRPHSPAGHVPPIALAKMLLPTLLPSAEDGRRILYLDSDMIVRDDLGGLATVDIGRHALGAVHDAGAVYKQRDFFTWNHDYFNSGMLLIEPTVWLALDKTADCRDAIGRDRKHRFMDQDALNAAFRDEVALLDLRWNSFVPTIQMLSETDVDVFNAKYGTSYDTAQHLIDEAAVLHFSGKTKPWHDPSSFLADEWWVEYDIAMRADG